MSKDFPSTEVSFLFFAHLNTQGTANKQTDNTETGTGTGKRKILFPPPPLEGRQTFFQLTPSKQHDQQQQY